MISEEDARELRINIYGGIHVLLEDVGYWIALTAVNYYDVTREPQDTDNPRVDLMNELLLYQFMIHAKCDEF